MNRRKEKQLLWTEARFGREDGFTASAENWPGERSKQKKKERKKKSDRKFREEEKRVQK